jgi:hypothetical protein
MTDIPKTSTSLDKSVIEEFKIHMKIILRLVLLIQEKLGQKIRNMEKIKQKQFNLQDALADLYNHRNSYEEIKSNAFDQFIVQGIFEQLCEENGNRDCSKFEDLLHVNILANRDKTSHDSLKPFSQEILSKVEELNGIYEKQINVKNLRYRLNQILNKKQPKKEAFDSIIEEFSAIIDRLKKDEGTTTTQATISKSDTKSSEKYNIDNETFKAFSNTNREAVIKKIREEKGQGRDISESEIQDKLKKQFDSLPPNEKTILKDTTKETIFNNLIKDLLGFLNLTDDTDLDKYETPEDLFEEFSEFVEKTDLENLFNTLIEFVPKYSKKIKDLINDIHKALDKERAAELAATQAETNKDNAERALARSENEEQVTSSQNSKDKETKLANAKAAVAAAEKALKLASIKVASTKLISEQSTAVTEKLYEQLKDITNKIERILIYINNLIVKLIDGKSSSIKEQKTKITFKKLSALIKNHNVSYNIDGSDKNLFTELNSIIWPIDISSQSGL